MFFNYEENTTRTCLKQQKYPFPGVGLQDNPKDNMEIHFKKFLKYTTKTPSILNYLT